MTGNQAPDIRKQQPKSKASERQLHPVLEMLVKWPSSVPFEAVFFIYIILNASIPRASIPGIPCFLRLPEAVLFI